MTNPLSPSDIEEIKRDVIGREGRISPDQLFRLLAHVSKQEDYPRFLSSFARSALSANKEERE